MKNKCISIYHNSGNIYYLEVNSEKVYMKIMKRLNVGMDRKCIAVRIGDIFSPNNLASDTNGLVKSYFNGAQNYLKNNGMRDNGQYAY